VSARRRSEVDPARLRALADGTAQTATLVEFLALDLGDLMTRVPGLSADWPRRMRAAQRAGDGVVARMRLGGQAVATLTGPALSALAIHPSDTVRGRVAFAIGLDGAAAIAERLQAIRPLAADAHFGVREWAWLAVRPAIAAELPAALACLRIWTGDNDANLRRFASEATRPRGVWCAHLKALVDDPRPGFPLLEPLRCDPSRYVRDSVGNWLNDAAKSNPDLVRVVVGRWRSEAVAAMDHVARRALRSL
jgi:3-methyladenine DNA glycosylase AlkC